MPMHLGRYQKIPARTRKRILKLVLGHGVSQRQAGRRTECHYNSVGTIIKEARIAAEEGRELDLDESSDPVRVCRECGNLCEMPCIACAAREYRGEG